MQEIILILVGLLSGFLGATVGGGGMIAIPILLFLGFNPHAAVSINKIGDIGAFSSAIFKYGSSRKIDYTMALKLSIIMIISSLIGSQLMIRVDAETLKYIIGIVILIFLPFYFYKNKVIGIEHKDTTKLKRVIGFTIYGILGVIGAMVGAGGATVILLVMTYFFGYKFIEGYATNTPAAFICAFIPSIVYIYQGIVPIIPSIVMLISMFIGGYIGSQIALTKGNKWIKNLFTLVIFLSVLSLFFL